MNNNKAFYDSLSKVPHTSGTIERDLMQLKNIDNPAVDPVADQLPQDPKKDLPEIVVTDDDYHDQALALITGFDWLIDLIVTKGKGEIRADDKTKMTMVKPLIKIMKRRMLIMSPEWQLLLILVGFYSMSIMGYVGKKKKAAKLEKETKGKAGEKSKVKSGNGGKSGKDDVSGVVPDDAGMVVDIDSSQVKKKKLVVKKQNVGNDKDVAGSILDGIV